MTPEQITDLERFEFSSINDVSQTQWHEIERRLVGHARKRLSEVGCSTLRPNFLAGSVVESVKTGRREWDPKIHRNLLKFLFKVTTSLIEATAEVDGTAVKDEGGSVESQLPRRRRRRGNGRGLGGSGILSHIRENMEVNDVIAHLPMIALIVSRLNDLLNPIAKPPEATEEPMKARGTVSIVPMVPR